MKKGYSPEIRTLALKLRSFDLTYAQISEATKISVATLTNWTRAARSKVAKVKRGRPSAQL